MSLDERLRDGLQRSAARGGIDEDDAFRRVHVAHDRAIARGRVVRQGTAVVVVLTLFAGVAIFFSWRVTPYRYRTVATLGLGAPSNSRTSTTPGSGLALKLSDPRQLAMAPATRRATLVASHLAPDDARVHFQAADVAKNTLALTVTAPAPIDSTMVARHWRAVFTSARRAEVRLALRATIHALNRRVNELHHELQKVDAQLVKLMPIVYHGILRFDAPNGNLGRTNNPNAPPPVPEQGSVHGLDLAFERIQILNELDQIGESAASLRISRATPEVGTTLVKIVPAKRIDATPPATAPALVIWLAGVVIVMGGGALLYRFRTRSTR